MRRICCVQRIRKWVVFAILLSVVFCQAAQAMPILVGIAGGTGSGKTTLATKIAETFPGKALILSQDLYYKETSHLSFEEASKINFDHPDAIDFDLFLDHLTQLKEGFGIEHPVYNFRIHNREKKRVWVDPAPLVIVEGILLFAMTEIRDLFDVKIFVDASDDIRLLRRMERDMQERGRDFLGIRDQYLSTVKPMHDAFVDPSKQYADLIVPKGGHNQIALELIVAKLHADLSRAQAGRATLPLEERARLDRILR